MKVLKRTLALIFALLLLISVASAKTVELGIGEKEILIADEKTESYELKSAPYINEKGRCMVPFSLFTEVLGLEGSVNEESKEAAFAYGETKVVIGTEKAIVNNEEVISDSFLEIKDGEVFVPVRFLGEAFGYNLGYSAATEKVILDNSEAILKAGNTFMNYTEFKGLYDVFYSFAYDEAIKSGATEEEIKFYAYQAAAETAISFVVMYDTFPNVYLDKEDVEFIKNAIEVDGKTVNLALPGLFALIQEKYYFSKGIPALKNLSLSAEVDKLYKENYICAKHILVEDEALAKELLEKAKNGEDFDALVKEYGIDPGMEKNQGGYVFTKGEMVAPFEAAAFALKEGEISELVKSDFGYHIIKREALPADDYNIKMSIAEGLANKALSEASPAELLIEEDTLNEMLGLK